MDLIKVKQIVKKNFNDYNIKSETLDEETAITFICVDLMREEMKNETPAAPKRNNRSGGNEH